jgi:hypothetical protein
VLRAAGDEPLRVRLREAGFRRADERTWERAAREVDAVLSSLVDR